ncbi:MAG: hypothetical protein ACTSYB_06290 [Candidatus Helarchaeota archaeon]
MKLYKVFLSGGLVYLGIGVVLELLYIFHLKDLVWILLIYPPPWEMILVRLVPYLGLFFIGLGALFLVGGMALYLKEDLIKLQKRG